MRVCMCVYDFMIMVVYICLYYIICIFIYITEG